MSIYHCSIKIISRSGGRSAVASAAYRSGERLYNEETGITHDFRNKGGVVMNEIMLPGNAPGKYGSREVLWNEVQQIEKRSDAQFAREVEVALPAEMNREEQIECVRSFINDNFISKGMIADWALHDKGDGNPHAHILLTLREVDTVKGWLQKQKSVFANSRDSAGRPVYDPCLPCYDPTDKEKTSQYRIPQLDHDGIQKTRTREGKGTELLWEKINIPCNDWNEHSLAETWRASWAEHCNRYLEEPDRIDHRSFERQGIEMEPTIHEGVTARQMESRGAVADRCQMNREIRERNRLLKKMKQVTKEITELITEKVGNIVERIRNLRGRTETSLRTGRSADGTGGRTGRDREATGRDQAEAGTDRRTDRSEQEPSGTAERDTELLQNTLRAYAEAEQTDREIEDTDRRIEEIGREIVKKEAEYIERFRRLNERRASAETRRVRDEARGSGDEDIRALKERVSDAKGDVRALIEELQSGDREPEEKRRVRSR